jgi:hypothetical protein
VRSVVAAVLIDTTRVTSIVAAGMDFVAGDVSVVAPIGVPGAVDRLPPTMLSLRAVVRRLWSFVP